MIKLMDFGMGGGNFKGVGNCPACACSGCGCTCSSNDSQNSFMGAAEHGGLLNAMKHMYGSDNTVPGNP
jgi:hypothetical protein